MKNKKFKIEKLAVLMVVLLGAFGCSKDSENAVDTTVGTIVKVNADNFLPAGLSEPISIVSKTLSNGTTVDCYKIVSKGTPTDHPMGPWCPTNISDDAAAGGIWLKDGNVYDVDGAFIKNLATFYNDSKWNLIRSDGTIKVTNTKEACQAAARPDVDPQYNNYCVECQPTYFSNIKLTYYIPVKPIKTNGTTNIGGGAPGGMVGVAFNGINFDPPAPTQAILGAYTLAPMDDAGGHVNGATGYHYHAATGKSKKVDQADGHAAMIGYAMDGVAVFAPLSSKSTIKLDECNGRTTAKDGYHYYAQSAEKNLVVKCVKGLTAVDPLAANEGPGGQGGPGGPAIDTSAAAKKLGITEAELKDAFGNKMPPDFATVPVSVTGVTTAVTVTVSTTVAQLFGVSLSHSW